jgi:hypothetical protein
MFIQAEAPMLKTLFLLLRGAIANTAHLNEALAIAVAQDEAEGRRLKAMWIALSSRQPEASTFASTA